MTRQSRLDAIALVSNVPLLLGAVGVVALIGAAVIGPRVAPFDPQAWRLVEFLPGGEIAVPPIPPNGIHPLGTDPMGRDLLSRILWGAQLSLTAVALAVVGRTILGLSAGLLAAWRGPVVDAVILSITDAISGVPQLILGLLLVLLFRDLGVLGFVLALTLTGWAELAQFVRSEVLRVRSADYVQAAIALGLTPGGVLRSCVLRSLVPQLAGVVALEAGSVLILLAELGFIGFFVSGGTFFVDDAGKPILPVRDRAPEWGQMLAGARGYTLTNQWVAFVPALVVVAAVTAANFLGEGLRRATDPHDSVRLSPGVQNWFARLMLVVLATSGIGFASLTLGAGGLAVDDARAHADAIAEREAADARLVAQVVRFSSDRHALARPAQLNFYYLAERGLLRVGYVDAEPTGLEVNWFEDQDGLPANLVAPLELPRVSWQDALTESERVAGTRFRNANSGYLVRVTLEQLAGAPTYLVGYSAGAFGSPTIIVPIDGKSGQQVRRSASYEEDARRRAGLDLGPSADLVGLAAFGNVQETTLNFDAMVFAFRSSQGSFLSLTYDLERTGLIPQAETSSVPTLRSIALPPSLISIGPGIELQDVGRAIARNTDVVRGDATSFAIGVYHPVGSGVVVDTTFRTGDENRVLSTTLERLGLPSP